MNRRKAITTGAALLGLPLLSFAEQRVKRIGFLVSAGRPTKTDESYYDRFRDELRRQGRVDGRDLVIEWRFAENRPERLAALAGELVKLKCDVIVTRGPPANRAAKQATSTIPIVVAVSGDPVGEGLIKNLARPEGNVTGFWTGGGEYLGKHLELLAGVQPRISRIAIVHNPLALSHPSQLKIVHALAEATGIRLQVYDARSADEIESRFISMTQARAEGLMILGDALFSQNNPLLGNLALKHRLASVYTLDHADAGGLFSYGPDLAAMFQLAAGYVDKILRGAKPGELPFQQPGRFELIVNLKTAQQLGLTISQRILLSADRIIR